MQLERLIEYDTSILDLHLAAAIISTWRRILERTGAGYTEQWAVYVANLMHQDSRFVIKVVRYGINILCLPDEHAVELVER